MSKQSTKPKTATELYENLKKLLSENKIDLLKQYFDAMANFYQFIPLKKAFEIINEQNDGSFSEEAFLAFAELAQAEERNHFYIIAGKYEFYDNMPECQTMEKDLIHEAIAMFDNEYERLSAAKEGKPYYVLPKGELLKYTDEYYMPESDQYRAMLDFIKAHVTEEPDNILSVMLEILCSVKNGESSPLDAVNNIIRLRDVRHFVRYYDEFEELYKNLFNNTRNPYLNGYTPTEYFQLHGDPAESMYVEKYEMAKEEVEQRLSEILQKSEEMSNTFTEFRENIYRLSSSKPSNQPVPKKVKIGRNDPCPCGSGKKYKKCCGA